MINAEHLVISGKFLFDSWKGLEGLNALKRGLDVYLKNNGYIPLGINNLKDFLSMQYILDLSHSKGKSLFKKKEKFDELNVLRGVRKDFPYLIDLLLKISKEGIIIEIISKPAFFFQIAQLNVNPSLNDFDYSMIIHTNKEFIIKIMCAICAKEIESPKQMLEMSKIYLRDKLDSFGLKEIRELLERGLSKVDVGYTEDGLTDLRSSLEKFLVRMVERIGEKSEDQKEVKKNINLLKDKGFIDEKIFYPLFDILYKWLYSYLSQKPVHKRELLNKYDANFLFNIFEEVMEYILYKIMYRV